MKLLSIDIETTGLDPATCSTLEVGCVLFDPQPDLNATPQERRWKTWECLIEHSRVQGEPYALQLNHDILAELAGVKKTHRQILKAAEVGPKVAQWLRLEGVNAENKATIVGKNYDAFDRQFLNRVPGWNQFLSPIVERRTLDVGSLYFCPDDGKVVGLEACLAKIGVDDSDSHRALDDALQVATAITRFFT
jgi:DNA polymerase III epsilon subunit-like protein